MASKTDERLLSLFNEASGNSRTDSADSVLGGGRTSADLGNDFAPAADSASFDPSHDSGAGQSYDGISGSSRSTNTSGGSGSGIESLASTIFGGALGLVPLIGGLFGLFGGGSSQQQVFQKYEMPSSISFEAADGGGSLVNSDYGQMGLPRLYNSSGSDASPTSATNAPSSSGSLTGSGAAISGSSGSGMPPISVNVQAMDAQSFMSYSGEIAKAVRDAMLNLSSLNDVVTDL